MYSVDGSFLAASSWDGVVSVWDSASPDKLVRRWDTLRRVTDLCFRHDNTTLAAATDGQVLLLDVASGNCRAIKGPDPHESRSLEPVAFSSSRLLACGNYSVGIFDIEDGTLLKKVGGPGLAGSDALTFSPHSSLLAAGGRDGVAILDLATGSWRQFGQYEEGGGPYEEGRWARVHSDAFSPDGMLLVSGDGNGIAHFWRFRMADGSALLTAAYIVVAPM